MTTTSAAVMQERVIELGLGDVWSKFEENGWNSLGTFAFAFSSVPGTGSDDAFCTEVVEKLMGTKDSPKKAAIRCLYYEAYTAATAEMNRRYNRTEDDKPRKVPAAEKEVRRLALQKRLPGLDMTEELERIMRTITSFMSPGTNAPGGRKSWWTSARTRCGSRTPTASCGR